MKGWAVPVGSRSGHLFGDDGRSLCGRYGDAGVTVYEPSVSTRRPTDCAECLRRQRQPFRPAGGPWTRHGHPVDGVTVAGAGAPRVARCGGPALCRQCREDAGRLQEQHGVRPAQQQPVPPALYDGPRQ